MILLGFIHHIRRNINRQRIFAVVAIELNGFHFKDVDQPCEISLGSDRNFKRSGIDFQFLAHIFHDFVEVRAGTVHFVHERHAGDMIFLRLAPNGFGLGLNATDRAENADRAVENAERTFDFSSEVHVSRSVNKIDSVFLVVTHPETGRCGGCNRNTALLLLNHPVHCCGTVMNFTDLVSLAGIKKNTFRKCGFSRINVSHNTDITRIGYRRNTFRRLVTGMFCFCCHSSVFQ